MPGPVIAERVLEFRLPGQTHAQRVTVLIEAPQSIENGNWSVEYEIHGPGQRKVRQWVGGVDSVQALYMALVNIPVDLRGIALLLGGTMTFLDSEDLKFPPPI